MKTIFLLLISLNLFAYNSSGGGSGSHGGDSFKHRVARAKANVLKLLKDVDIINLDQDNVITYFKNNRQKLISTAKKSKVKTKPWNEVYIIRNKIKIYKTAITKNIMFSDVIIKKEDRVNDPRYVYLNEEDLSEIILHEYLHHTGLTHTEDDQSFFEDFVLTLITLAKEQNIISFRQENFHDEDSRRWYKNKLKAYLKTLRQLLKINDLAQESLASYTKKEGITDCTAFHFFNDEILDLVTFRYLESTIHLNSDLISRIIELWNNFFIKSTRSCLVQTKKTKKKNYAFLKETVVIINQFINSSKIEKEINLLQEKLNDSSIVINSHQ